MSDKLTGIIEGKILTKNFRKLKSIFSSFDICELEIQTNNNSKKNIELYDTDAREVHSSYKVGYNIKIRKQFFGDYMLVRN